MINELEKGGDWLVVTQLDYDAMITVVETEAKARDFAEWRRKKAAFSRYETRVLTRSQYVDEFGALPAQLTH